MRARAAISLSFGLWATTLCAQGPEAVSADLMRAWLSEQLDRDGPRASRSYQEIADDDEATPAVRALAMARLAERARLRGDQDRVDQLERRIEALETDSGDPYNLPVPRRRSSGLLGSYIDQLGDDGDFTALRQALDTMEQAPDPRPFVASLLQQLDDLSSRRDQTLLAQLRDAYEKDDQERLRRLFRTYRQRGNALQKARMRQALAVAEHHVAGRHREAERIAIAFFGGGGTRGPGRGRGIDDRDPEEWLREVQRSLGQRLESPTMDPYERRVLEALDSKLSEWTARGETGRAVTLLRRLPRPLLGSLGL